MSSCVINNGFASSYFSVDRGVRQGVPLSPLLLILSLEILSCCIRQNEQIQGIKMGKEDFFRWHVLFFEKLFLLCTFRVYLKSGIRNKKKIKIRQHENFNEG